jgi:succinate-semialdehyde dehydrogenase/glutarate-semialdehyde dehydrogenase
MATSVALQSEVSEITIRNPATGEAVGSVPVASAEAVGRAAQAARQAQPRWAAGPFSERAAVLRRFHDLILGPAHERVLDTIQDESGKTRRDALVELLTVAGTAAYYLAHGEAILRGGRRRGAMPGLTGAAVHYKPHGLVGIIAPWNYPFLLGIGDALPALLAGNAVMTKPSEITPLSAALARELLIESGLDEALVPVVHGAGAAVGQELVRQVDYVGFTGSAASACKVAVAAAQRLIPYSLELGGKNPMIVLRGAHLPDVVTGLIAGSYSNCGQTCIAIERVYVERTIVDEFVRLATKRLAALRLGWSRSFATDIGSLISIDHARKVSAHVEDAAAHGAQVLTGGRPRPDLGPAFFEPTLLTGVTPAMQLARAETFGPVVAVYPVANAEEAIALANDSEFGLNASVWAASLGAGREIARRLETGSAGVNSTLLIYHSFDVPMGGVKQSGIGRRHGAAGMLRYTQAQAIVESLATGGGYESLLVRATTPTWSKLLRGAFRLRRHVPGVR